jgi:hypothetical protein
MSVTSTGFTDYVFDYFTLADPDDFLLVAAVPPSSSVFQTLLIKRIKIEETPPASSFTVSSSPTSIACGANTPVTFTANSSTIPAGATVSYLWNLGAGNGWEYSGSAAPSAITTTTNTLTLTPACGSALSNVSATITVNGTANNTNAVTTAITQPALSIAGNTSLCSGSSAYSVNGLVCNATLLWTAPPAGLASISNATASPTTLTYGGTSGSFVLTANVTSCGATVPVTLPVHVGPYTSTDFTLSGNNGSNYWCPNQTMSFGVTGPVSSNYQFTIPTGWSLVSSGTTYVVIKAPTSTNPPTGTLSVSLTEPCGTTVTLNKFLAFGGSSCSSGNSSPYSVSPNPAATNITISCISLQTYCNISAVQITDLSGNVKSSQTFSTTNQSVQMPVYFLQNGTYIARTYSGTQWYTNQFVVQH